MFIILAVGLVGLVVLGLVAIGGVLVFRSMYGQDEVVEATPTIVADELEPTLTPQSDMSSDDTLSSATTETLTGQNGEVVTPSDGLDITSTLLPLTTPVQPGTGENGEGGGESGTMQTATSQALAVAPTAEPVSPNTPVPVATPASHEQVPATGTGILGFVLIGLGLVTLVFTARFLRHAS
ncbi:MAG: hypothetical protein B6242_13230 [Anaerolineaceae bacterium 4572_78]|nr:MAG: hypothetical protein B6242_13230 [Anaerolineaceae bacterium 4572_78]